MTSVLAGSLLAGIYFYTLNKTAFRGSYRSLSSGLFWGLGGFSLRIFSMILIFLCLTRFSTLNISWVLMAFTITFPVFLFQAAGKIVLSDLKKLAQPSRRI